ncbi:II DNA helicase [Coprinopsis cinerea AmutBmut pab1-1]|nr:II DNA helicase [Coprinopsis cinerea AmutBmut pab1-1]
MAIVLGPLVLEDHLQQLRTARLSFLVDISLKIANDFSSKIPNEWICTLPADNHDRKICYRAILICWAVTGELVPRVMQLKAVLAIQNGKYVLVSAGTGSGKTLPMALNILLDDPSMHYLTIILCPLKRLQKAQVEEFTWRFKICTVVINEDTPRDERWYSKYLWNSGTKTRSLAKLAIVTTEQLEKSSAGHWSSMAILIRDPWFQRYIARINVDEAHSIHIDGLEKLLPNNFKHIHVTSNRPNTVYALHQVDSIENMANYRCFVAHPFSLANQPRVLIFIDDRKLAAKIVTYLKSHVPPKYRAGSKHLI